MRLGIRVAVAAVLLALFYCLLAVVTYFGVRLVMRAFTDPNYGGFQRVMVGS